MLKKILLNKWVLLLSLVISSYIYAGVYERNNYTPIDDLQEIITDISEDEQFLEDYETEQWDMSIEEYHESISNITTLKSHFLQGPISFLTSCLILSLSVLIMFICIRLQEAVKHVKDKTTINAIIDRTIPAMYAESCRYLIMAAYATITHTLLDYNLVLSIILSVSIGLVPFIINCISLRKENKAYSPVIAGGTFAAAVTFAFQLI